MARLNYNSEYGDLVVCLGYFDCAHRGHLELIQQAKETAKAQNCPVGVFTFSNNPYKLLRKDIKVIYNIADREYIFGKLGVDIILEANFDREFINIKPNDFLDKLTKNKNIKQIIVGEDYTYGKDARGNVASLKDYCLNNNISLKVVDIVKYDGQKISSTLIRKLLVDGDICRVNELLSLPYFIEGNVVCGRKDGSRMGTPTVNINLDEEKVKLKDGVYATYVYINEEKYKAVTNIGNHPTFDDMKDNIECHLIDFSGNLYGKNLRIEFIDRLRDVKKFENVDELVKQIHKDINCAKEIL